jgi:hypothetical protein
LYFCSRMRRLQAQLQDSILKLQAERAASSDSAAKGQSASQELHEIRQRLQERDGAENQLIADAVRAAASTFQLEMEAVKAACEQVSTGCEPHSISRSSDVHLCVHELMFAGAGSSQSASRSTPISERFEAQSRGLCESAGNG